MNEDFGFKINEPFYIRSKMPMRRCIETNGSNAYLNTLEREKKSQHWVFDERTKTIKSVQYEGKSFSMTGNNLVITTTSARWFQLFRYQGSNIVNERGKVMDISGNKDALNQNIHMWKKHNGLN
jgi:NADPH-dependent glutamate synthase beta subunit-like oxidoreductase